MFQKNYGLALKVDFFLEQTSTCYEILWNRQGVIFGSYPGSATSSEGNYGFEGDLDNIPDAPDWLIAEMKHIKANEQKTGFS